MGAQHKPRREELEKQLRRAERHGQKKKIQELTADLELPPFPKLLRYVWNIHLRIRARVKPGFNGPNPMTWPDIDAFVNRTRIDLTPWECARLEDLDDIYIAQHYAAKKPDPQTGKGIVQSASMDDVAGVKALMGSIGRRVVVRRTKGKKSE